MKTFAKSMITISVGNSLETHILYYFIKWSAKNSRSCSTASANDIWMKITGKDRAIPRDILSSKWQIKKNSKITRWLFDLVLFESYDCFPWMDNSIWLVVGQWNGSVVFSAHLMFVPDEKQFSMVQFIFPLSN